MKQIENERIDNLAISINSTDESRRMFEAARSLSRSNKNTSVHVKDENGNFVTSDSKKAEMIRNWFTKQFNLGDEKTLDPFDCPPQPLIHPIKPEEVRNAAQLLNNARASGPDNIPGELLKYACDEFYIQYADILNACFETNTFMNCIGEAILSPLQKPKKAKGPIKNLRPITLSNSLRKIMSLNTLRRIDDIIDTYTGPWQAAYKRGRSCADIVWSQRILTSIVLEKEFEYSKMGIDMTAAFDTIKRSTILNLLEDAGCARDDVRLVRF